MASVTNLDSDVKRSRGEKVNKNTVDEVRAFIEESIGERLRDVGNDDKGVFKIAEALKDGVALCKLADAAVPGSVRGWKPKASMPFVQRENIALFLRACEQPPLNLHAHDRFLTVDLYDGKDMLQVLQCIGAFSRVANRVQPAKFPNPIGGKKGGVISPQNTGSYINNNNNFGRPRGISNASTTSSGYRPATLSPALTGDSRWGPSKNGNGPLSPGVSSWSKKADEGATSPAWNISQYGYMGGASQGNLGVSFGGRRQITSAGPKVPSLAEKEKQRREKETADEKTRIQAQDDEQRRVEVEEARAVAEEKRRFAEETEKLRMKTAEEKRQWEEQERRWQAEEEQRKQDEREAEARMEQERQRTRSKSDARLRGQFLSQYHAENDSSTSNGPESDRIHQLEKELEQARERERQYERERQAKLTQRGQSSIASHDLSLRLKAESPKVRARSRSRPRLPSRKNSEEPSRQAGDDAWLQDEREYLRQQHSLQNDGSPAQTSRPLPEPVKKHLTGGRPLPDPSTYGSPRSAPKSPSRSPVMTKALNRTDRFLSANPAPQQVQQPPTYSNEIGGFDSTAERDAEDRRRAASQAKTKAAGWASKSLLEREMEMERQRQQEWEESQKETKSMKPSGTGVDGIGGGIGGKWDVNQWTGYTGGDGQNRGSQGIGSGRREIVGPRPPPGRN